MLADIVERLSNWKHASFRRDGSTLETMNEAADEITTLRARVKELESGGWISVDTALPDHEQVKQRRVRVLVKWIKTEAVFTLWYGHRFGYNSPSFFEEHEWTESDLGFIDENDNPFLGESLTYSTITHWQYLPSAPKE